MQIVVYVGVYECGGAILNFVYYCRVLSLHQQDIQTYKPLQVKSIISRERMSSTTNLTIVSNCTTTIMNTISLDINH